MKYKITCRSYRDWKEYPLLCESYLEFEARFLKSKTVLLPFGLKTTILETLILISMLMTCL